MHELSIVQNIIDIAQQEAGQRHAQGVEHIELDIGTLAGIDFGAFSFAWEHGRKATILEHADCQINRIEGSGYCSNCSSTFKVKDRFDACPVCNNYFIEIRTGKELAVKRLTLIT